MRKQNYRQAKRHREETRKKRTQEKLQKKMSRTEDPAAAPAPEEGAPVAADAQEMP